MATTDTAAPGRTPLTALSRVRRGVAAVERIALIIACVALLAMTALMVAETAMRYLFGSPFGWSFGFIQDYLLPGYFFLALAYTFRAGAHVSIDFLYQRCSPTVRRVLTAVGRVLVLGFAALLLWAGVIATHDVWRSRDIPPPGGAELSIPSWTWQIIVPIGAALLTVRLLADLLSRRKPEPVHLAESGPSEGSTR